MSLLDPRLQGCRRLFLRHHEVIVDIGIHDFERGAPQRVVINVDLYVPLASSTPASDDIGEVVDYDFVRHVVAERIARGRIALQETLANPLPAMAAISRASTRAASAFSSSGKLTSPPPGSCPPRGLPGHGSFRPFPRRLSAFRRNAP